MLILVALVSAGLWTVITRSLLRSAIGLALTSAILSIIMFQLHSPIAAVFELSVCTGLISVLFISTISLTHPMTQKDAVQHMKERWTRFWALPFIVAAGAIVLALMRLMPDLKLPEPERITDVRVIMWNVRQLDMMGQIVMLLAGVFGILVLFKEMRKK